MPHYATLDDLTAAAGAVEILDVADRDQDGVPDPDVVESALAHSDNVINGYLSARYQLPFGTIPDLVRTWAVAIARYKLHRHEPEERVRTDYEDALRALKDAARGLINIPVEDGSLPTVAGGGSVMAVHPPRPRFTLEGW
ncbi:DUF1320 domain-containing protein [Tistrella bauzanensis]|uniref:gp436 family protein n=1 Tax=Tistrella TaxID=171436 RepID=UPI0031F69D85